MSHAKPSEPALFADLPPIVRRAIHAVRTETQHTFVCPGCADGCDDHCHVDADRLAALDAAQDWFDAVRETFGHAAWLSATKSTKTKRRPRSVYSYDRTYRVWYEDGITAEHVPSGFVWQVYAGDHDVPNLRVFADCAAELDPRG